MRIGVVGCGYWGSKHVRVLHTLRHVERVVAIDVREERTRPLSLSFPTLHCSRDLESALEDVDAVVIATPPSSHLDLALKAINGGKHVLVEKPLTTTVAGARRLIDEAAARSVTLMVGHTFEYNAAVRKLRELVQNNQLGKLYYVDTARLNLGLYQSNVNVVWDLAPHDISIINYVLQATPTMVQAWGSKHAHRYLEDVAYIALQYGTIGVNAHIHVSWLDPCKVRRVTVVGSRKMAVYNDLADQERIRIYDKGVVAAEAEQTSPDIPMSYRYGDITSPYIDFEEPLAIQDAHFIDCIGNDSRPLTDGHNGLAVVQVLEAASVSLREGRPVHLGEVTPAVAPDSVSLEELIAIRR